MTLLVRDALQALPIQDESRTGYTRDKFKHWNFGKLSDGCNTLRIRPPPRLTRS
ncbi:hypothetical protein AB0D57_36525 [Streptomyces sp. NPDC048275]|uniref:hypothetical protein n=1 Tax=Streptomyces sp. NPDC048275 TaxID=3155629 RepID=UPI0033C7DECF